jgi:hypothetical protein
VFLSNAFGFMNRESRSAVCAKMAEKDESFYVCTCGDLCERACTLNVCFEQTALPALCRRTGKMIDLIHTA